MIEFVLLLPILMIILLSMVFFGHQMVRKQNVMVSDRHFAWRYANYLGEPQDAQANPWLTINLGDYQAQVVHSSQRRHLTDAPERLVAEAYQESSEAGSWANTLVNDRLPRSQSMHVEVTFPVETLPFDNFVQSAQRVGDRHYREGVPWRHGDPNTRIWGDLRDHYVKNFDDRVQSKDDGSGLINRVRNLYLKNW
jgi:hypothetical protein